LSGGLDSALNLALAVRYRGRLRAVTFDYGQRAARRELQAARRLCRHYSVEHRRLALPWLREAVPRALAEAGAPLPSRLGDVEAVWVPNRNGVFVAVGAALAEAAGAGVVVAGFNAEEAAAFPDNSAAFVAASNRALRYSTRGRVQLRSYTAEWDKVTIVRRAAALGVPLENVYPCYGEGPAPCGRCASCRRTAAALRAAGFDDLRGRLFPSGTR
jgi:7-cyano-7-deazaguanine synthase